MNKIRKHPRVYAEVPVKILGPSHEVAGLETTTHQLGGGGSALAGPENLEKGKLVNLMMDLGGQRVMALGRIVYEHQEGKEVLSGVQFLHMNEEAREMLDEYICRKLDEDTEEDTG